MLMSMKFALFLFLSVFGAPHSTTKCGWTVDLFAEEPYDLLAYADLLEEIWEGLCLAPGKYGQSIALVHGAKAGEDFSQLIDAWTGPGPFRHGIQHVLYVKIKEWHRLL